ncbi:diacylglycerol/lipid kinase family protein [Candidatus Uabimicrobium amorphum]|uniref:Diacylglycerol kinase n=1 Tax=Uabimicrobium amorphum TaxID=2596890 RepID=A0A5S9IQS6_UABAM|nr:diacylglycerol kinase family protein [Candidatus Uabimicrobium amorphum]BBM86388.1 diacylglycerol kinase [Candidatus Uabimicrobium amorphum]
MKKIGIVFNGSKSRRKLQNFLDLLPKTYETKIFVTSNVDDITLQTQKAIGWECDLLVSAGGDGTLLYVINSLKDFQVPLMPLPLGTGNDFSSMLGIRSMEEAVAALEKQTLTKIDLVETCYSGLNQQRQNKIFCSTAGVGIFANLFRQENFLVVKMLRKIFGNLMNYICFVVSFFITRHVQCRVHFENGKQDFLLKVFEVSNVRECGGLVFTPCANTNNSIFDLWIVSNTNVFDAARIFFKILLQKHIHDTKVDYFCHTEKYNRYGLSHLTNIQLEITQNYPFHLHGEFIGYSPEYFKLLPHKLSFLALLDN